MTKAFLVIKPEVITNPECFQLIKKEIYNINFISNIEETYFINWMEFFQIVYELNENDISKINNPNLVLDLKFRILSTLKTYNVLYKNVKSYVFIFDIDENKLSDMENEKLMLRKKYNVDNYNYYIKLEDINYNNIDKLINYNIDDIKYSLIKIEKNEDFSKLDYNVAWLNKIHFPDPYINDINYEYNILKKMLIKEKNDMKDIYRKETYDK